MLLLDALLQKYPTAKRQTLKRMVEQRRVKINGIPATRLKMEIPEDAAIQIDDSPQAPKPSLDPLELIHEDDDLLVINKPPGLLTSTTPREKRPTAIAIIRQYLAQVSPRSRPGVIHRLDGDASGLLVFSKNDPAFEHLKHQFFKHTVERIYTAVAQGQPYPPKATIDNYLIELPDGRVVVTRDSKKGQQAITEYETLITDAGQSLLRVKLHTGRKHQIRAHMAARKTPIVGDALYGPEPRPNSRLLLAATRLAFDHPTNGKRVFFEIKPPREITSRFPNFFRFKPP